MRLLPVSGALLMALLSPRVGLAQSGPPTLEDRVKALEIKVGEKEQTAGGESASRVSVWFDDGLRFGTRDDGFVGRIGGHVIVDYITHCRLNESAGKIDGFSIDSAAIDLQARFWKAWQLILRAQVDF